MTFINSFPHLTHRKCITRTWKDKSDKNPRYWWRQPRGQRLGKREGIPQRKATFGPGWCTTHSGCALHNSIPGGSYARPGLSGDKCGLGSCLPAEGGRDQGSGSPKSTPSGVVDANTDDMTEVLETPKISKKKRKKKKKAHQYERSLLSPCNSCWAWPSSARALPSLGGFQR